MTMKSRPNDDAMADLYRDDPALALEVINASLEDGDQGELLTVLRQVAQASGGAQAVAQQAQLHPTQHYRPPSSKDTPDRQRVEEGTRVSGRVNIGGPSVPK